ncbi:MAG TPA: glycosyltransferase family 1 protein [Candidatus Woesearchaeota archaeon]|nr:glycosyltransferase family 1 protein [Candidatus Woesearchaeota archaeon]
MGLGAPKKTVIFNFFKNFYPGKKKVRNTLKVLMLGWELPPFFAGGVGMVCYHLTRALCQQGVDIIYVMPFGPRMIRSDYMRILIADHLFPRMRFRLKEIDSLLGAYETPESYDEEFRKYLASLSPRERAKALYGPNVFQEAYLFARKVRLIAMQEDFDIIHAHDHWTFPAAIEAKKATGKPLVIHVHITEFDKTGGMSVNQRVYEIERAGMHAADLIIVVSNFIKQRLINSYGVPPDKIRVVHNAAEAMNTNVYHDASKIKETDKIVLFIGRITLQKGPDYFVEAAKKVLEKDPNVKFIMAGTGDMLPRIIERVAELGIADKFIFPGFVTREEVAKLNKIADVFVMPSVSEPFGIVPLEAMWQETPAIISKQSGVSEVLNHVLKVDFWDVNDIANKILAVLHYRNLHDQLKHHGLLEVRSMTWEEPARKCIEIYKEVLRRK